MPDLALAVHARSVRNCTWVADLWVSYFRTMERNGKDKKEVYKVSDQAFMVRI